MNPGGGGWAAGGCGFPSAFSSGGGGGGGYSGGGGGAFGGTNSFPSGGGGGSSFVNSSFVDPSITLLSFSPGGAGGPIGAPGSSGGVIESTPPADTTKTIKKVTKKVITTFLNGDAIYQNAP